MKITKSQLRQIIREELSLVEQGFFDDVLSTGMATAGELGATALENLPPEAAAEMMAAMPMKTLEAKAVEMQPMLKLVIAVLPKEPEVRGRVLRRLLIAVLRDKSLLTPNLDAQKSAVLASHIVEAMDAEGAYKDDWLPGVNKAAHKKLFAKVLAGALQMGRAITLKDVLVKVAEMLPSPGIVNEQGYTPRSSPMKITKSQLQQIIREELLREIGPGAGMAPTQQYGLGMRGGISDDTPQEVQEYLDAGKFLVQILDPTAITTLIDPAYHESMKAARKDYKAAKTADAKMLALGMLALGAAAAIPLVGRAIGVSSKAAKAALRGGDEAVAQAAAKGLSQASPKAVKQTLDYVEEVATIPIRKPGKPPATVRDRIAQYGKSYTSDLPRLGDEILFSASPGGGGGRSYGVVAGYANKPGVGRVIVVDVQGGRLYRPMVTPDDLSKMSIQVKRAKPRYSAVTDKPGREDPARFKPPEDAVYGARTYLDP